MTKSIRWSRIIREDDIRDNKKTKHLYYDKWYSRDKSILTDNSTELSILVFNAKYFNTTTEITNHFSFSIDDSSEVWKNFCRNRIQTTIRK
jgi:hypothetical protein